NLTSRRRISVNSFFASRRWKGPPSGPSLCARRCRPIAPAGWCESRSRGVEAAGSAWRGERETSEEPRRARAGLAPFTLAQEPLRSRQDIARNPKCKEHFYFPSLHIGKP